MLLVGKKCTLWPQTILELLAVFHKTNIHWISKNTLETKMFYTVPLSLKILLNLCLELSCKQETAGKICIEIKRIQVTQIQCSDFFLD